MSSRTSTEGTTESTSTPDSENNLAFYPGELFRAIIAQGWDTSGYDHGAAGWELGEPIIPSDHARTARELLVSCQ